MSLILDNNVVGEDDSSVDDEGGKVTSDTLATKLAESGSEHPNRFGLFDDEELSVMFDALVTQRDQFPHLKRTLGYLIADIAMERAGRRVSA